MSELARDLHEQAIGLAAAGRHHGALHGLAQTLALVPGHAKAHYNRGRAWRALGQVGSALDSYARALDLDPAYALAHNNRGNLLRELGRPDSALDAYDAALRLRPDLAAAHVNRATALKDLIRLDEAVAALRTALRLMPDSAGAHSNLLVTLPFMSSVSAAEVFEEHRRFGLIHEPRLAARRSAHANTPDPGRVIRLGYLATNLREDAIGPLVLPLIEHHRRDRFRVHVFAHAPDPDAATRRVMAAADAWTEIHGVDDAAAAAAVRAAAIDILVHPMGHWAGGRIMIMAHKPAPIQVGYLCNAPTWGLQAIDYSLIDPWLDHDGTLAGLMVETPVPLPSGFEVMRPNTSPAVVPPPSLAGGGVTFGSFNNPAKLSPACVALWARALAAVPTARLLLKGRGLDRPAIAGPLLARFAAAGVDPGRIAMRGPVRDMAAHLTSYGEIDIALDTLPFSGGRTTLDALWMGVPVITLPGPSLHSRLAMSFLMRLGLPELSAASDDGFVRVAAELAADPARLARYRTELRSRVAGSSLTDVARHVVELEDAFLMMWRRWCGARGAAIS